MNSKCVYSYGEVWQILFFKKFVTVTVDSVIVVAIVVLIFNHGGDCWNMMKKIKIDAIPHYLEVKG